MTHIQQASHPRLRRGIRYAAIATVAALASLALASPAWAGDDQGAPSYYSSGLSATPTMGWNTYYGIGGGSGDTEAAVKSVTDFMVSSGLASAGYKYVWLDGGWQASTPRNATTGELQPDATRFPDGIAALATYVHSKGLKLGIYTDAGSYDPTYCGLGSGGHYTTDANQFAAWNVDAIKVDFLCGIEQNLDPKTVYTQFSAAVQASGRAMVLNVCDPVTAAWGVPSTPQQQAGYTYTYGPTIADSWRTDTDVAGGTPAAGEWADVLRNADDNEAHPEANGPGHFNDPDNLIPMRTIPGGTLELSQTESTSQLVLWAEMASPLVIGSDPRTLSTAMLNVLKNPAVLAVDQDPLGIQGVAVASSTTGTVYSKVLSGSGQRAVVLLNRTSSAASMTVSFANAGLTGTVSMTDLLAQSSLGTATTSYSTTVPAHGTIFLKLSGTDAVPGSSLGATATASPALVRVDDTHATALVRGSDGAIWSNTLAGTTWGTTWTSLGGPTSGQILGQPAAYGSTGGRIDLFVRGTDNVTYQRTFSSGSWGSWTSLGGTVTDAPTVAFTSPTSWTLFARGSDGQIWDRTNSSSTWSSIGSPNSVPTYGRPSAVTDASGTYVAVRASDDSIWWRVRNTSGTWGSWTSIGGTVSGSPTLLATAGGIYLFARAGDYTLWQNTWHTSSSSWAGWTQRTEFGSDNFTGAVGAANGASGTAWIVVNGVDGHVHQLVL
jgi:alpha-galactosidase